MQDRFNDQSLKEKEGFNTAATQYEEASTLNKSAANEQIATTVGTAFNQAGDLVNGMGGGESGGGGNFGGSGNVSMGSFMSLFGKKKGG